MTHGRAGEGAGSEGVYRQLSAASCLSTTSQKSDLDSLQGCGLSDPSRARRLARGVAEGMTHIHTGVVKKS